MFQLASESRQRKCTFLKQMSANGVAVVELLVALIVSQTTHHWKHNNTCTRHHWSREESWYDTIRVENCKVRSNISQ